MTEVTGNVIRVRRSIEVRRMALVTVCVDQLVVAVRMTRLARRRCVCTSQREPCCAVIECRRLPHRCRVTLGTIMTEVPSNMVRAGRLLELCLVALVAVRVDQLIVAVRMTGLTLHGNVCTRQWESCCAVIECCTLPVRRRVTL